MDVKEIKENIEKLIKKAEKAEKAYANKQDIEYRMQLIYENPNAVKDVIKWSNRMKTDLNRSRSEIQNINLIFAEYLKQKGYNEKEYREIAKEATVMSLNLMAKEGYTQTSAISIGKSIISGDTDSILKYGIDLNKHEEAIRNQGMLAGASLIFIQMNQKMKNETRKTSNYNNEVAMFEETINDLWAMPGEALDLNFVKAYKFLNSSLHKGKLGLERMEMRESLNNLPQDMELLKTYMTDFNKLIHSEAPQTEKDRFYQKIIDKFPILEPHFENSVESSDFIVKDLDNFTQIVGDVLEQQYKDREFEILVSMNIDENLEIKSQNLEKMQKEKEKYFKMSYQVPLETFIEDKNISSLAREYYKLSNPGYQEYYSKDEVAKVKKELIDEILKNKEVSEKYGSKLTRENSQFFDTLAEKVSNEVNYYDFNKKEQDKLEKLKVSKMAELKQGYENRDPMSEYTKYVIEELYPEITSSVEKNIKVLHDESSNILKAKNKFEKNFGVSFDEMTKNDKINQSLNNYLKNSSVENYKKLESDLAKEYKLKAGKTSYSLNPTAEFLGVSSTITRSWENIKASGTNMLANFSSLEKQQSERYMKAIKSNVVTNSNNVLDYSVKNSNGKTSSIPAYKQQKSKADENLEKFFQGFNNVQKSMGKTSTTPTQKTVSQTVKVQRKVQQPQRKATYKEPTKWEVMSKELKKAVKDLESKAGKMGKVILDTSDKLAKLEIEKLHKFAGVMGMSESDVLFSEIGILEKQRQIALEVGKKEKVESLTAEIKEKKKKAENAKFYDDINGSYEQKTNQLNFKPSDKQYDDFKEKFAGYYDAKMENLTRLLVNGLITKNQFEQESLNLMGEKIEKLIDLKKYNEAMKLTLEKYQAEYTKIQEDAQKDVEDIKKKGIAFGSKDSETIQQEIGVREKERLDLYSISKEGIEKIDNNLAEEQKKLENAIKNKDSKEIVKIKNRIQELKEEKKKLDSEEKIKKANEDISKLKEELDTKLISEALSDGIRGVFKNINPKDFRGSLASNLDSLFEKQFNVLLDKDNPYNGYKSIIEEKMKEAFDGYKLTGNYVLDQSEYNKRFEEFLNSLIATGNEGLVNLAGSMKMERVKTSLDDLASTLSRAGSVLKDDFLTNLSVTAESLSSLTSIFQNTNLAGPIGEKIGGLGNFLSPFTSVVGTVFGTVNAGVSLFRSFGIGSNKNKKHNEEEKRKANEWYENKSKENENLFSEINTLTNSIQNLTTKLIQNIASDTSDKNIAKQKSYYNTLIGKTGDLYEGQITATGHSSKKKGLFGGKKNSHATLSQGFDEYFGSVWKNTARDSGSLQSFYDTYLQNFDLNTLKRKLGKSKLDNNNIEEVKLSFLRFIEDVRVMEQYSANLPKNGILESFEGVEVADLFELRNEYQKQLEDIYKGMGKDPEKYRDEILSTVNSLIQNDQVIVSAFQDVKSRTIEQLSSGNDVILGLATGMESYFSKLESNFSKVFYDMKFQGFEEKFSNKFENLTNNLADFRLSGRKDFDNFLNENLNFWDLFTDLKNTEYIENDMKHIIDTLKNQAKASGLSDEVINTMFPDEKINEKTEKIKNALENSIRKALETNSFEQFSMSLGDSIYNNVKDSLVKAFYESQSFQALADKYFLTEDYKNALDGAGSFKDAYSIIQQKLNEVELKLQSEGMDFRGTNATDGNYYGMSGKQEYKTSGILDNSKGVEFAVNLYNYGFMSNSEFMNTLKKEMKEFLYESGKEEV